MTLAQFVSVCIAATTMSDAALADHFAFAESIVFWPIVAEFLLLVSAAAAITVPTASATTTSIIATPRRSRSRVALLLVVVVVMEAPPQLGVVWLSMPIVKSIGSEVSLLIRSVTVARRRAASTKETASCAR